MTAGKWAQRLPWAVGAAVAFSCANDGERPPPPVCQGECGRPTVVRTGPPTSSGGAPGEGEGGAGGEASGTRALTGNVQLLFDNGRFDSGEIFAVAAQIKTTRANGKPVTDLWNGTDPFLIEDLAAKDTAWLFLTPENAQANDSVPTLEPVVMDPADAHGRVTADLAVVRDSTIDGIFTTLSMPIRRDDTLAQVVLRLTTRTGGSVLSPIAGVSVAAPAAADLAYGVSGHYSDVATQTDATGVVVLLNVPATTWPGATVSIQYSGAKTGGAQVQAIAGAVSLVTLSL